jgi:cation transport regulator ChaC
MFLFSYGSLINRTSAENVLKRRLSPTELVPALLRDYLRCWWAREDLFFEVLGREAKGVFLDLRSAPGSQLNGVLIQISAEELVRLKLREKNYDCLDVSQALQPQLPAGQIFTFVCRPEHRAQPGEADAFIPQRYIDMVRSGCLAIGPEFLNQYDATTEPTTFPVVHGAYRFLDPIQALHV